MIAVQVVLMGNVDDIGVQKRRGMGHLDTILINRAGRVDAMVFCKTPHAQERMRAISVDDTPVEIQLHERPEGISSLDLYRVPQ